MMEIKDDCIGCVYLNQNGTCANNRSIMFGITTNERAAQICRDRRYYDREAVKKYKKKRKIESIYDYE